MSRPYHPIDCSFYDRLEEAATLRRSVRLRFRTNSAEAGTEGVISDLLIRDGAEWLVLADGRSIRLDDLIALDEHLLPGGGSCGPTGGCEV